MKNTPPKTPTPPAVPPEDKMQFQREMDATRAVYDALLSVPPNRREAIFKAVCILLPKWHKWNGGENAVGWWYWRPNPGGTPDHPTVVTVLWSPERTDYYTEEMPRRWCSQMDGLWQQIAPPKR